MKYLSVTTSIIIALLIMPIACMFLLMFLSYFIVCAGMAV